MSASFPGPVTLPKRLTPLLGERVRAALVEAYRLNDERQASLRAAGLLAEDADGKHGPWAVAEVVADLDWLAVLGAPLSWQLAPSRGRARAPISLDGVVKPQPEGWSPPPLCVKPLRSSADLVVTLHRDGPAQPQADEFWMLAALLDGGKAPRAFGQSFDVNQWPGSHAPEPHLAAIYTRLRSEGLGVRDAKKMATSISTPAGT